MTTVDVRLRFRTTLAAVLATSSFTAAAVVAPPVSAHEALMPANERHGLLVGEPWVRNHAVPFDEAVLEQRLHLSAAQRARPPRPSARR